MITLYRLLCACRWVSRRHRVAHIVPPGRNINHPDLAEFVRNKLAGNIALCFGCTQVFERELIDAFDVGVNLHSGSLPKYRGWMATLWSVCFGEVETDIVFITCPSRWIRGQSFALVRCRLGTDLPTLRVLQGS